MHRLRAFYGGLLAVATLAMILSSPAAATVRPGFTLNASFGVNRYQPAISPRMTILPRRAIGARFVTVRCTEQVHKTFRRPVAFHALTHVLPVQIGGPVERC